LSNFRIDEWGIPDSELKIGKMNNLLAPFNRKNGGGRLRLRAFASAQSGIRNSES